ncbi:hypothetical protein AAFF_G00397190 [Aldrovandia affinis]|uniref:Uncharacterized protein n=1 Tax=Aldrovandia affinis TaxID=143900 RepID=A0AAD7SD09_9TELE|nr:hypothetical protein AAFF_G00397190 [Aldrovandia affinis]
MQTVGLIYTLEQCLNRMQTVGLIHTPNQCLNRMQTVGLIHTLEQCLNRMQTVGLIHTLEQCLNRMQTVMLPVSLHVMFRRTVVRVVHRRETVAEGEDAMLHFTPPWFRSWVMTTHGAVVLQSNLT